MRLFLQIAVTLSVVLFLAQRKKPSARNVAAGLCLLFTLGLVGVSFRPEPPPPGPLDRESRIGQLISQAILEEYEGGEVLLVSWPLVDQKSENWANCFEEGLIQGLGPRFTIRCFPVEEWRDLDPSQLSPGTPPPLSTWAALAERLPDCTILVSMVGHPAYPVPGLYTRCESLFLTDPYFTLSPDAARVDTHAPLRALVLGRSMKPGKTRLDTVELVVPQ